MNRIAPAFVADIPLLRLDGVDAGILRRADGGWASAPVISEFSAGQPYVAKRLGSVAWEPLVLQFDFTLAPGIYQWVQTWCTGAAKPRAGSIDLLDLSRRRLSSREFSGARIEAFTVSDLDASSKVPGTFTLKLLPTPIRSVQPIKDVPAIAAPTSERQWLSAGFRLEIPGLDCSRIQRIASFTIQRVLGSASGGLSEPTAPIDFPHLRITLAEATASSWASWHDDFVINGKSANAGERQGTLVFLNPAQKELARLRLLNLGIFRVARVPASDDIGPQPEVHADLYCERMELSLASG